MREGPVTKQRITSKWIYVTRPHFVKTHTHTFICHCLPRPYTVAPPLSVTHEPFVVDCWLQLLLICTCTWIQHIKALVQTNTVVGNVLALYKKNMNA